MKLSILIVNWNTRDLVVRCLNSILENAPSFAYEVIVVDNHSQDGSAEALLNLFSHNEKIRIIESPENLGFAGGVNLAYKNSSGKFLLLLNPDTEVGAGTLENLVAYLEINPRVGIVGPRLESPDGTVQPSVRRFPGIWSSLAVFVGWHRFFRPKHYLMDDFSYTKTAEVDQVMGAALLTRREIVEKLGFLDENFWLWYEEVDFCKRVKAAGYQVQFYPGAVVMHRGAESFTQMDIYQRKKIVARSLIYYFQKNGNFFEVAVIKLVLPVVLLTAKALNYLLKALRLKFKPHV